MSDGNEARANLQEKLEQARRLLHQISDPTTTESLKAFIADLENRLRNGAVEAIWFGPPIPGIHCNTKVTLKFNRDRLVILVAPPLLLFAM